MSAPQGNVAGRSASVRYWVLALLCVPLIAAQLPRTLYMPRTYRRALLDSTRSPSGRPGPKYWENHGRYHITVTASPPNRTIHGVEQVSYFNNSPDTLHRLVFKLLMNVHRPGAPRGTGAAQDYLTTGEHVDSFAVNGERAAWPSDPEYFTLVPVDAAHTAHAARLRSPRHSPGTTISRRPAALVRACIDSTTYFLAYFYPRVAVLDDYDGWDTMDFTGQQEFYSDFNDYDVTVNVPANFVVWGTGTLTNASSAPAAGARATLSQASFTSDST